jgi:hypothetical protein
LSRTHAYLKEPLPSSAASCCLVSAQSLAIEGQMRRAWWGENAGLVGLPKKFPLSAGFVCPSPALGGGVATKAERPGKKKCKTGRNDGAVGVGQK